MSISERDKKLLMILGGVAILLVVYLLVFNPYNAKTEALQAENEALAAQLAVLQDHYANLETYETGITEAQEEIDAQIVRYPNDIRAEDKVMYAVSMEEFVDITIPSVGFGAPAPVMEIAGVVEDEYSGTIMTMPVTAYGSGLTFSCTMGYQQLKDLVTFVYATQNVTNLTSLNVSYDSSTGNLSGSVALNQYHLAGLDPWYYPTAIPETDIGKDNIFSTAR